MDRDIAALLLSERFVHTTQIFSFFGKKYEYHVFHEFTLTFLKLA